MNKYKISDYLLIIGIIMYPYQNLTFEVYDSLFDLSIFFILASTILFTFKNNKVNINTFYFSLLFIFAQLTIFLIINVAPFHRLLSGLIWFGGLVLIYLSRNKLIYDCLLITKLILINLLISSLYCIVTISQNGLFSRPRAFFTEPSYAGLSFYSASSALFAILFLFKLELRQRIIIQMLAILFLLMGIITLSLHIVTFLFVMLIIILFFKFNFKSLKTLLPYLFVFFSITYFLYGLEHFSERLTFTGTVTNISVLSWLRGFDQMKHVLFNSPLLGMGLGSTGYFNFESSNTYLLDNQGVGFLNLNDAYSAFFRLSIEMGLPFIILLIYYIYSRITEFKKYFSINRKTAKNIPQLIPITFLFIFSFSLIIGILIKEPTYSRSFVYVAWFLFVTSFPKHFLKI